MSEFRPKLGPGRFQWNAGWFGGLLGGTAFMLVGVVSFAQTRPLLALVWVACYVLSIATGIYLWTRRNSLAPYPAIQCLLFVVGIFSSVAILTAIFTAPAVLSAVKLTPSSGLLLLLMFPGFMLWFHVLEQFSRRPA